MWDCSVNIVAVPQSYLRPDFARADLTTASAGDVMRKDMWQTGMNYFRLKNTHEHTNYAQAA
jgi:hypothetical protein